MNRPVKLRFFLTLGLSLCLTLPALAQDRWVGDTPPHVSLVEGAATLERDGRAEPAVSSMLLLTGDRLRTESGRVEVLFTDQSVLHLDQYTVVDLLSDSLFRLLRGRLRLAVWQPARRSGIGSIHQRDGYAFTSRVTIVSP